MSENIKIPIVHSSAGPATLWSITITPDLARQIVALSAVPAFEANTLDRLASIEDHCNRMLELTKMGLQNKDSLKNIRSVLESEPFLGEAHQSDLEKAHAGVTTKITEYLGNGGLFNPEMMHHESVRDMVIEARDEIAALRARVAELEHVLAMPVGPDRHIDINGCIYTIAEMLEIWQKDLNESEARAHKIAKLEADLAAEREKNTYRHCTCDDHCDSPCPVHRREVALQNERDAARAEVAALKARKVKLPGTQRIDGILPKITARAAGWNDCLDRCADAIRAAEVEVES